ncbi:hypothetical protein RRG08_031942 [Elysia crispata]|uniref:Uncharacterized protein n=1 Tax=Elysia crispata TaxID=231223 RepID=A0AAE1AHG6_9GAST|nr:hypothetical protein RRG08_031942 [Elysia crispata]
MSSAQSDDLSLQTKRLSLPAPVSSKVNALVLILGPISESLSEKHGMSGREQYLITQAAGRANLIEHETRQANQLICFPKLTPVNVGHPAANSSTADDSFLKLKSNWLGATQSLSTALQLPVSTGRLL